MSEKTILKEDVKSKIKRPKMYAVILHNDDYTTMEFVIAVLVTVFNKTPSDATKIMFDVHKKGKGIAGMYPYDIAITKISQVKEMADESGFPLKMSLKEE